MIKTHRPLFGIACCLITGIIVAGSSRDFAWWWFGALFLMILSAMFLNKKMVGSIVVYALFVVLGAVLSINYQTWSKGDIHHVSRFIKNPVTLKGVIDSPITYRKVGRMNKTSFVLRVKEIKKKSRFVKTSGKILVNVFDYQNFSYGQLIELEGRLHFPFEFDEEGNFSYVEFLKQQSIYRVLSVKKSAPKKVLANNQGSSIKSWLISHQESLASVLDKYLTINESGIMKAILLGKRSDVPHHIRELFVQTGTAHILAISGLHIGMVSFFILLMLKVFGFSRSKQAIITIACLMVYALLTGGRPPVVRAVLMGSIFLSSFIIEREMDSLNSLGLAAIILLLINPLLVFNLGFQLSFVSVFFIVSLLPHFYEIEYGSFMRSPAMSMMWVSLAAFIGVTGLSAYYFNIITPIAVIVNVFILPLMSMLVVIGIGLLIWHALCPWIAASFGMCLKLVLNGMIKVAYLFNQIPFGHFNVKWQPMHLWIYYGILLVILIVAGLAMNFKKERS